MNWFRPRRVVVVSQPLLNKEELVQAYSVPQGDRQLRATMQILEEHIKEAHEKAELFASKGDTPIFYDGGAEWIGRVRDKISEYLDIAIKRSRH